MTRAIRPDIFRHSLTGLAAVLVALAISIRANAAVAEGTFITNAAAAEEHRALQFHEAEISLQDKLRVGRERYEKKQVERAKVIEAMSSQLQARQQTVAIHPMGVPGATNDQTDSPSGPSLAAVMVAVMVAVCFIGMGHYWKRANQTSSAPPFLDGKSGPLPSSPARARYRITALKPVTICANVEVAKSERKLTAGRLRHAKEKPAWIKLKAGEMRDKVDLVFGIHPDCAPHGRRVYLIYVESDIVPLGTWNDGELPKVFFEHFLLEVSD
jgi:hypothetical protein